MESKRFRDGVRYFLFIVVVGLTAVFFWWKFQLALTRYFDVDEFAYLHWAYNLFSGRLPYRDFFFGIPPGFLLVLTPIFLFFHGTAPFMIGRVLAFVIFCLLNGVTGLLFWEVRRSWVAFFIPLILIFLPLPSDKFLEIRPDTLAMLLVMVGLLFQVKWMRLATKGSTFRGLSFLSGFFYSLSFLVLPKALPQVAVAILVAVGWGIWGLRGDRGDTGNIIVKGKRILSFFVGLFVPLGFFWLWAVALGIFDVVWYSVTILPRELGQETARLFPMQPDLFFYPNGTYYGENGWSIGLLVNHVLWLAGLTIGIIRLFIPFLVSEKQGRDGKSVVWIELLIAASFFSHVAAFFLIFPLRHAQYLIPIAVFIAFYLSDGVNIVWEYMKRSTVGITIFFVSILGGLGLFYTLYLRINTPKLAWTNKAALSGIENMYKTIPLNQYVLDLDGRTFYYKNPSYICCLPYGEFSGFLSRKLPALIPLLEQTNTRYVFEGELQRVNTLPPNEKDYIRAHYAPYPNIAGLLERK